MMWITFHHFAHDQIKALVLALGFAAPLAVAQQPALQQQSFHHFSWGADRGIGEVFDVEQAPDGFLWLTTSVGIFRFDGVSFETAGQATGGAVNDSDLFSVFVANDGGIWLSTRNAGLMLWKDQHLTIFKDRRCTPAGQAAGLIVEDAPDSLWIRATSGLSHLKDGVCTQPAKSSGYPGGQPLGLLADRAGSIWVKAPSGGLYFLSHGKQQFQPSGYATPPSAGGTLLRQAPDNSIWIFDDAGLKRLTPVSAKLKGDSKSAPFVTTDTGLSTSGDFLFAPDGSLWLTTPNGLRHYDHADRWQFPVSAATLHGEEITQQQGLSSNAVTSLLVDREGSLWAATTSGLDRLRRTPLTALTLSGTQEHEFAVAAGDGGSIWMGNRSLPLTRIAADLATTTFAQTKQIVCLRRDRNGNVWAAGMGAGSLWQVVDGKLNSIHYPDEETLPVVSLAVDRNNDLWIATRDGDTYRRTGNTWIKENENLHKRSSLLGAMASDDAGNVWFAFSNNLVHWDGAEFHHYTFNDPQLNISTSTMFVSGSRVWLAGRGGIEFFANGQAHRARFLDKDLPGRVSGIVETPTGDLWANTFSGIVHVSSDELKKFIANPSLAITAERFDALDGLPGLSGERLPEPSLIQAPDGKLWFATSRGLASLNPAQLNAFRNRVTPPVVITSVMANGHSSIDTTSVRLPARSESVEFHYTALSLAIPERVFFRYKLEGYDKDWVDAGTRREAFYTSLSPGRYTFRVMACNDAGLWSEATARSVVFLTPAFYQTWIFRGLCILGLAAILWWLVRLRIAGIVHQQQLRLNERLAERERIARELHDTLLQSLFGISLHFQTVLHEMDPDDPNHRLLCDALDKSDTIMREGRDRVRDLRGHKDNPCALESLSDYAAQLQNFQPIVFNASSTGTVRRLEPLAEEEVVLIFREALNNAFHHSGASLIELTLAFEHRHFCVTLTDNGRGIDESVLLTGGREDHWGLPGMRERARKLRADFQIESPAGGGTVIRLSVPSSSAYRRVQQILHWRKFFRRSPRPTVSIDSAAKLD